MANLAKNPVVKLYLTLYNIASFIGWGCGLVFTIQALACKQDFSQSFALAFPYIQIFQTTMLLEVVHSLIGFVRSPFMTTLMQVLSRIFLVWVILFPTNAVTEAVRVFPSVSTMFIAWSITECVRYSFYAINLWTTVPWPLQWVRYSAFFILYPLGAGSEMVCALYAAYLYLKNPELEMFAVPIGSTGYTLKASYLILAGCSTYIPGFPKLYFYMVSQRKKIMRKHREEKKQVSKKSE
ncbi:Protein-tyrosine phosphatase-like PTPLA [Carpediemonas membranifera]|uniref:very-long-chain (3R)-3-hydroxyacyl-CoA dehydratase n=1 Tax=Carpediemonas membranifera TaxID=201153 RepID=A0A8J6C0Y5_9EUKA|nr:Protein-tyrosine phosphatase-like PTPLA [Carpediemonas membranifera]|eukprot:KAG9397041.1 Protein-tyrosine phosphatase-like PTPLA [Carpediemonas membranifera]